MKMGIIASFADKAQEDIFLGYSMESMAYRVFVDNQHEVIVSLNVTVNDTELPAVTGDVNG